MPLFSNEHVMRMDCFKHIIKLFFVIALCVSARSGYAQNTAKTISSIEEKGSWYYIYDDHGKKVTTLSKSKGTIAGFGSDWFVLITANWIYLYDINGHKYKTLSVSSVGEVKNVGSSSFVTRKGAWLYTFDRNGKKINTRSAK